MSSCLEDASVRAAQPEDAEALARIYNYEVMNTLNTLDITPKTPEQQASWIGEHLGAYPAIVCECRQHGVVGFGALSPYRDREAYRPTAEDSVYVAADHRRRGVGRLILEELVKLASSGGFHALIARVARENEASLALHRSVGFTEVGLEREVARKFGRWVDVVILEMIL
jgi:L-amino acid N-acyltransferase YncA